MVFAEYFINHMVNIMHSPFFIMDENGILIQMFGEEMEITKLYIDRFAGEESYGGGTDLSGKRS